MARKRVRGVEAGNDSNDSPEKPDNKGHCPHVGKGVDIGSLKKSWKKRDEISCQTCRKKCSLTNKKGAPSSEQDLWICMKCGHIGCGNSRHDHHLHHFHTPRSDCHAVVTALNNWTVRCLQCQTDIILDFNVKAFDAVEYLRRNFVGVVKEDKAEIEEVPVPIIEGKKPTKNSSLESKIKSTISHGPHRVLPVLGLENIGNTCYMNAVLQSLAQTPGLIYELESVSHGGVFNLPGGENLISKEHGGYVPPLEGKLGEPGLLTKAVIKLLSRIRNGDQLRKAGICNENPGEVLRLMKKLSNTFYIGEQHDSHELLRLLLEGLRTEDLKRYQRGILNSLEICTPGKEVTAKEREKLIAYNKQTMKSELAVDKIFSGSLVSILKCLECGSVTTNFENFMDISLPVESEKPKVFHVDRSVITTENKPSKHQLKKERKLARRGKKKNKGNRMAQEPNQPIDANSSESASDSEADVEDNLDSENTTNSAHEDPLKSENSNIGNMETNNKQSADESSVMSTGYSMKESPESTTYQFSNEQFVYGNTTDHRGTLYSSSPDEGAIVYTCSPEPGTVVYGCSPEPRENLYTCSPEPSTVLYGCSPEPPMLEDFGSCEGGRGSPASSIEQADWEEGNDFVLLVKGIEKGLHVNENTCLPTESFEMSEEDNVKEGQWGGASREELMSSDFQFDVFSSGLNPRADDEKKTSSDEPCNNRNNNLIEIDSYDDEDVVKHGVSGDMYNDLDDNKKVLDDATNKLHMNNIVSDDDSVWGTTLAPQPKSDEIVYSVFNCLGDFFTKEVLSGSNQIGCLQCTKMKSGQEPKPNAKLVQANALKQLLFLKLPKILTLHFKRFEVLRTRMCKITRKVSFPMVLDISPYTSIRTLCAKEDVPAKYELYAVVEHSGHMTSGHYVAYVSITLSIEENAEKSLNTEEQKDSSSGEVEVGARNNSCQTKIDNPTKKWYLISDTHVREVSFNEVSNAEAYLLFYKRLN